MELHYKQHDIEKAIKEKLVADGFPLRNKTLNIDFSMGRGANGLSAVLSIDDIEIPGDPTIGGTTAQLLASPANAAHLEKSISQARAGETTERQLAPVEQPSPVVAVVDDQVEVATTAPATVAEIQDAATTSLTGAVVIGTDLAADLLKPATIEEPAIAHTETSEAAAPAAEEVVAEVAATPAPKTTTSLFGNAGA